MVRLRLSPSYWLPVVGSKGRFDSGDSRERWRTIGTLVVSLESPPGGSRDVLEALCEGGPTNSAGAGKRLVWVFESFLSVETMIK